MKKMKNQMFLCAALCMLPFFLFCQNNRRLFHVDVDCTVSEVLSPPKDSVIIEIIDTVSFTVILAKGDTFKMGCTSEQSGECMDAEKPVHDVVLSDFYIGKTEVTQSLWKTVMGGWSPALVPDSANTGNNYPLCEVSWNDIVGKNGDSYVENGVRYYENGFCYKLSVKANGGDTTGMKHYRLPTEAEWEYAARGGIKSKGYKYSGSNTVDDVAWYENNIGPLYIAKPVGSKKANELGLYDMSGSLWEWCADSRNVISTYPSTLQINPCVLSGYLRVCRGGVWCNDDSRCRVSHRDYFTPATRGNYNGFRLAVTL
jgi:formylglycine-generating enzyme required for sulfatase activity